MGKRRDRDKWCPLLSAQTFLKFDAKQFGQAFLKLDACANPRGDDTKNRKMNIMIMESKKNKVMVFAIAVYIVIGAVTTSVSATTVSLPFEISGYVFNADGSACNGPTVSITNLNTGETFSTMTLPSSNYYRAKPAPSLDDVSEGDMLQFEVSAGTESGVIDHRISASDPDRGTLQFNITFSEDGLKGESVAEEEQTPDQTPLLPSLPGGPGPIATPTSEEGGRTPSPTPATPLPEEKEGEAKGIPGFETAYAIIGFTATSYLILRRKKG